MERSAVLIIDDNQATRTGLVQLLNLRGYRTREAENGRSGFECLRSDPVIAVVVLDLGMPVADGYWFRTQQLADPALAKLPLIVFTGADDAHLDAEMLRGTHVLHKPFDVGELLDTIGRYCQAALSG